GRGRDGGFVGGRRIAAALGERRRARRGSGAPRGRGRDSMDREVQPESIPTGSGIGALRAGVLTLRKGKGGIAALQELSPAKALLVIAAGICILVVVSTSKPQQQPAAGSWSQFRGSRQLIGVSGS